ncbi:hypothetical protein RJT34_30908 [Clitoria ternatea]|uniref:Uncharacterized protein n=1 Tax=Clitoria ternatea TaxID=43366 RepID=A0AAN9I4H7_CLITE
MLYRVVSIVRNYIYISIKIKKQCPGISLSLGMSEILLVTAIGLKIRNGQLCRSISESDHFSSASIF